MSDKTNYHSFSKFDRLDEWDYNPDFEKLDRRLELRGALEDRPSSAPDGAKFVVDDSGSEHDGKRFIYRSNTDSWEHRPANFSAVSTGEVGGGVAGGNTVSGIAGTTGDVLGAASYNILSGEIITISSTSFVQVGDNADRVNVNLDRWGLQNSAQQVYISGRVEALDTSEDLTVRLSGRPETELVVSENGFFASEWVSFNASGTNSLRLEAKVSGGTADLQRLQSAIGREIQ